MKYIKTYFIIIFLLFSYVNIKAQSYSNLAEVLSSGGGESTSGNYSNFGVTGETFVDNSVTGGVYSTTIGFINSIANIEETPPNSVNIFNNQTVKIYPNPATEILYIENNEFDIDKITIYNILGKKVFDVVYNNSINISNLPNGVYILKLVNKNGINITTTKFIKE